MSRCNVAVFGNAQLAAAAAGDAFIASVLATGARPAGLAAGRTMKPVYDHLVEAEHQSEGLFACTLFSQLDEIIEATSPAASFAKEITDILLARFTKGYAGFLTIESNAAAAAAEADRHLESIHQAGVIAVQLLGIGVNGHVGFNEPGSRADTRCRVTDLAASTIERNGYAAGQRGITIGIADILAAKKIILVATGAAKAAAVLAMIRGPKTTNCPASLLRDHPDIWLFFDEDAAIHLS